MVSSIDPDFPQEINATTSSVRDNFQAAADDHETNETAIALNTSKVTADTTNVLSALDGQPIEAATLDTGQGANKLHPMDQDVREAAPVTFAVVTAAQLKATATGGTYANPQLQFSGVNFGVFVDGSGNEIFKNASNGVYVFTNSTNTGNTVTIADVAVTITAADFNAVAGTFSSALTVGGQINLAQFTVATLPSASATNGLANASDAAGGPVPVHSNGSDWLRVSNDVIVTT